MAGLNDPILATDYDAIQSTAQELLGTVTAQTGYGQTDFKSSPYPFIKTVTNVTRGPTPTVTCTNHGLVANEIIYFYDISTGMTQLNDKYVTVASAPNANEFTISLNTSESQGYSAWSGTGKIAQYVISANQFANLRTDLRRIREHQEGTAPALTTPTRGSIIRYSAYTPFANMSTTANTRKFWGSFSTFHEPDQSPDFTDDDWSTSRFARLEVEWPSLTAIRQYFNAGGYIEFESNMGSGNLTGDRIAQKNYWWSRLLDLTPVYFGARSQANMGNRSGNWTSLGYYNLTSSLQSVYKKTGADISGTGASAYNSNFFEISARTVSASVPGGARLRFDFEWSDGHANIFAENVTGRLTLRFVLHYPSGTINLNSDPTNYPVSYTDFRAAL
jgi:hypothetical protein